MPLSDAAIYDLAEDFKSERRFGGETYDEFDHYEFARAIESAHGIGKAPRNDAPIGQINKPANAGQGMEGDQTKEGPA